MRSDIAGPGPLLRRLAMLAVAAILVLPAMGCETAEPDVSSSPTSSVSSDWDEIPQSEGLEQIDIDGVEGSPITWEVPEGTEPGDPIGVAQRYITLYALAGTPGADFDPALSTSVADGEVAQLRGRLLDPLDGWEPMSGPQWVWLFERERTGEHVVVLGCADWGYFQPEGVETPADPAWAEWYVELEQVEDFDGNEVWKVYRALVGTGTTTYAEVADVCPDWAQHTP